MECHISSAKVADLDDLVGLFELTFPNRSSFQNIRSDFQNRIHLSGVYLMIARAQDESVGFISAETDFCNPNTGYIDYVGVHPSYRREGICRNLILTTARAMDTDGLRYLYLIPNKRAEPAYERIGFERINQTYMVACIDDLIS